MIPRPPRNRIDPRDFDTATGQSNRRSFQPSGAVQNEILLPLG